ADTTLYGLAPRGYGFTNLALYVACVTAIVLLGRVLGLSPVAASLAALIWAVNPHGINMALVWISGRTSLLLTLCSVVAAIAMLKGRMAWMAAAVSAALASKEEAIALPFILLAWHVLLVEDRRSRWRVAIAALAPLAVYAALRQHSAALTPASAPPYYQFSFAPAAMLGNALEYADRAATIGVIALIVAAAALRASPAAAMRSRLLGACVVWFAGASALTLFLPIRSSLYAVFPSVGAAVACAALIEQMLIPAASQRPQILRVAAATAVMLVASMPIYRARNGRYVEPAPLSERARQPTAPPTARAPAGATIVLRDVSDPASSFVGACGTFAAGAVRLKSGVALNVWIEPPPADWHLAGLQPPERGEAAIEFAVDRGRIFRVAY